MGHPNILDKIAVKLYPRYLYPGQTAHLITPTDVTILHRLPSTHSEWVTTDVISLSPKSIIKYLGLVKDLKLNGEIEIFHSVFQIILPVMDNTQTLIHHVSKGDLVLISPTNRQFIYPDLENPNQNTTPIYYDASSPPIV